MLFFLSLFCPTHLFTHDFSFHPPPPSLTSLLLFSEKKLFLPQFRKMLCDFAGCEGYILQHTEGSTCMSCNRLQDGAFESCHRTCDADEVEGRESMVHEISYLMDRHLISRDCANHGDKLFRIVRAKKINYSHNDLVIQCVIQAVYDIYGLALTLVQISHILSVPPNEKSFRRKHRNLCKNLPDHFSVQKIHTPPLALLSLGLPKSRIIKLHYQCKKILSKCKYSFSYEVALLYILKKQAFTKDLDLIKYICSFPNTIEIQKCELLMGKG